MVRIIRHNMALTAMLYGEIDHCSAKEMRGKIDAAIAEGGVKELHFDFSHVTFMDSSGVGMLIGRYRTMASRGGRVYACGLNSQMERLYRFAGLHRIIAMEELGGDAANE